FMCLLMLTASDFELLALIAVMVARQGTGVLTSLAYLLAVYVVACLVHVGLVYGLILKLGLGLRWLPFIRGMISPMSVAVSTTSSSATLPVTTSALEMNLGVPRTVTGFVLPLGATINMDGTGVYLGVVTCFAARLAGVELTATDYVTVITTATLASIGAAGVPGGSLLMVGTVLQSLGLPMEVFGLVASVDRLADMARTCVNVTGDSVVAVWVARSSGQLDLEAYDRQGPTIEQSVSFDDSRLPVESLQQDDGDASVPGTIDD
ncbi:MAG: cation:dicarboxylase symporter family transporter, partial [Planctomycetota bacterium]